MIIIVYPNTLLRPLYAAPSLQKADALYRTPDIEVPTTRPADPSCDVVGNLDCQVYPKKKKTMQKDRDTNRAREI